jgi:hypothetical protein
MTGQASFVRGLITLRLRRSLNRGYRQGYDCKKKKNAERQTGQSKLQSVSPEPFAHCNLLIKMGYVISRLYNQNTHFYAWDNCPNSKWGCHLLKVWKIMENV